MTVTPRGLSVILPVRNGGASAIRCIDSIKGAATAAGCPLEIIVVDNGSTDGSRDHLARQTGITLLDEPQPGSYAARNRGAEAGGGEFLLFTDSDCEVEPGWAAAAVQAMADDSVDAVQGHTSGLAGQTVWSKYCGRQYAETLRRMAGSGPLQRVDTRNLAVRASTFSRLGGFRIEWTHAADWEFGARLHRDGGLTISAPEMGVRHHDPEQLQRILLTRKRQAACMASMCDQIPWLMEGHYLAPANRWYHGARHVPLVRQLIAALLTAGECGVAAWLKTFHRSGPGALGYRLYKLAGTLAGVGGLYRPSDPDRRRSDG